MSKKVIIVGGGIIGLLSAYRLAKSGFSVEIFDPAIGRGATFAAAGMLAPGGEITSGEESQFQIQLSSPSEWASVSREIVTDGSGLIDVHNVGTLYVGWDNSDRRLIQQHFDLATEFNADVVDVDRENHHSMFEHISPRISDGILLGGDAWVDPDQVVDVLKDALAKLDVIVHNELVEEILSPSTGVQLRTTAGSFSADVGLIATGSSVLPKGTLTSGENVVRPVRGMTVHFQGFDRSDQPMVRGFIRGRRIYLVSRPGGYNVVGASSDETGVAIVEAGELQRLLRDALELFPALETAEIVETRIGLRPAAPNHEPFFEELGNPNWAWSSGHYRHGITLAPRTSNQVLQFAQAVTQ